MQQCIKILLFPFLNEAQHNLYLFIPMCYHMQYKIIHSNTSLFSCLILRSGYMFRSQGPSAGLTKELSHQRLQYENLFKKVKVYLSSLMMKVPDHVYVICYTRTYTCHTLKNITDMHNTR
jgi:hypothetical protein